MSSDRVKHLEMIQAAVSRLSSNSFAYKAWAVALVSALFALAASTSKPIFILLAAVPTVAFWGLDAYYLLQERHFRSLYDGVRHMTEEQWLADPFTMDTRPYRKPKDTWSAVVVSSTVLGLYLSLLVTILVVAAVAASVLLFDSLGAPCHPHR